ncbi:SEL1-like repeat protein [Nitrogeniibacter aestuarii]|uniref:SEL1-like repeat protein n=1 Tax=Nitrogeniibacter aestuarii TaxID=2815343 RepID=UPI001E5C776F|nr:SEL1-like repeat protein [Nitrogeniibacter aestuarii]
MGNRSFLYIESADGESVEQIAEANNNFPGWWQIALADGLPGEAITDQRVFGENGTANLTSDACSALERIETMCAFVLNHPAAESIPHLRLQLEALPKHLGEQIGAFQDDAGPPRLSANLDELSWLGADDPEIFIEKCRQDCNVLWSELVDAMHARNFHRFNQLFGLDQYGNTSSEWSSWAWSFGLASLEHPYFYGGDDPPDVAFEDFEAPPPARYETSLGLGFECFEENGKWGVIHEDTDPLRTVIETPQWDNLSRAGIEGLAWCEQDEKFGLLQLTLNGAKVIVEPRFDNVYPFEEGLAAVSINGKLGLLTPDGQWRVAPMADNLGDFFHQLATFQVNELEGILDTTGRIVLPPTYDAIGDFYNGETTWVEHQGRHGIIHRNGTLALPVEYESVDMWPDGDGYFITRGNHHGCADASGTIVIEPCWDDLERLGDNATFKACIKDRWGVIDQTGQVLVEALWDDIHPRRFIQVQRDLNWLEQRPSEYFVLSKSKLGLCDGQGRVRVPLQFDVLENLSNAPVDPHLCDLLLAGNINTAEELRCGVYDLKADTLTLTPRFLAIRACVLDDDIVYLSESPQADNEQNPLIGIHRRDGSAVFEERFAWIAEPYLLSHEWMGQCVVNAVTEAWQKREPVRAMQSGSGTLFWLHADGSSISHEDHLIELHNRGDRTAALSLGRALRSGSGMTRDPVRAREWLARAAGLEHPFVPAQQARESLVARLFGRRGTEPAGRVRSPDTSCNGNPEAQFHLAEMLAEGEGGPVQAEDARLWLSMAFTKDSATRADIGVYLGYLWETGAGGEVDLSRAFELYRQSASEGHRVGLTNLGLCYRNGTGVAQDIDQAIALFSEGAQKGSIYSTYLYALTLHETSEHLDGEARDKSLNGAVNALNKIIADPDCDEYPKACALLGEILLSERYPHRDLILAQKHLENGARASDKACISHLIKGVFGNPAHPSYDPDVAEQWEKLRGQE